MCSWMVLRTGRDWNRSVRTFLVWTYKTTDTTKIWVPCCLCVPLDKSCWICSVKQKVWCEVELNYLKTRHEESSCPVHQTGFGCFSCKAMICSVLYSVTDPAEYPSNVIVWASNLFVLGLYQLPGGKWACVLASPGHESRVWMLISTLNCIHRDNTLRSSWCTACILGCYDHLLLPTTAY